MADHSPTAVTAIGRAPGKIILAGEHAVVYGRPALAMPWPALEAIAVVRPSAYPLVLKSTLFGADLAGLYAAAAATLRAIGAPPDGLAVDFRSTIPAGAGLGSSAAMAVALVRAIGAAFGVAIAPPELLRLVDVAEMHAHGRSSGLDAATIAAPGPILFTRGEPARAVPAAFTPALVVAHSGRPRNTRAAVAVVTAGLAADTARMETALDTLGQAAREGADALAAGDMPGLGHVMDRAQAGLVTLGVSDPALDDLVTAARAAGALGAKLTGAGRGGCIVALAHDAAAARHIAQALRGAGATQAWTMEETA